MDLMQEIIARAKADKPPTVYWPMELLTSF